MTSYFDDADRSVREINREGMTDDDYLAAIAAVEAPVIRDVLLNTGDREFPDALREKILGCIAVKAIHGPGGLSFTESARDWCLTMRSSELLSDLHSAFHALASRRVKARWGYWSDSPRQNLVSRDDHDLDPAPYGPPKIDFVNNRGE